MCIVDNGTFCAVLSIRVRFSRLDYHAFINLHVISPEIVDYCTVFEATKAVLVYLELVESDVQIWNENKIKIVTSMPLYRRKWLL